MISIYSTIVPTRIYLKIYDRKHVSIVKDKSYSFFV